MKNIEDSVPSISGFLVSCWDPVDFNPLILSWDTTSFSILVPEWWHPFFITPTPIFFNQQFNFHEFVSTYKNQSNSSFCSRDTDWKILQSKWPSQFWPIPQELDFSQRWNLRRNIANNINFHYRPNSEKTHDRLFQ